MKNKKKYVPVAIKVFEIEMEDTISAASARIDPLDLNGEIIETWVEDPDETKSFTW